MNRVFERFVLALMIGGLCFSCKQGAAFKVEGKIESAKGDTLYLEHRGLGGVVLLDSAVLKENGSFAFKQPAPQNPPEFYQLRIGDQRVVLPSILQKRFICRRMLQTYIVRLP